MIGERVYRFDQNRRVYAKDSKGNSYGGPIYREHFRPYKVVGEEGRSWLVTFDGEGGKSGATEKVGKTTFGKGVWFTQKKMEDAVYVNDRRHKITEGVRRCDDATILRMIEENLVKHGIMEAEQ